MNAQMDISKNQWRSTGGKNPSRRIINVIGMTKMAKMTSIGSK